MKTLLSVILGLCIATFGFAQPAPQVGVPKRTPQDLEKLLAPIALYPDALVALILPASTNSADLVLAARLLATAPAAMDIDAQPWDESVKSLARYPEVVKWMDENLAWTRELGEVFAVQPADVMNTIQKLRSDAVANGLLQDTPQHKVVVRGSEICIVPAQENVIYVPTYDPDVLIYRRPAYSSWLSFSMGFATGSWLYYDCDWGSRTIWVYRRPNGWNYRPDWHGRGIAHDQWRPSPQYWNHVQQSRSYGVHPIPHVAPPHFPSHSGIGPNRDWDNRSTGHLSNASRNFNDHDRDGRPDARHEGSWDLRQHPNGVVESRESHEARIRSNNTHTWAPARPAPSVSASAAITSSAGHLNSATGAPPLNQERRHSPEGMANDRFPRQSNGPGVPHTGAPGAVHTGPPAVSAPGRIGQAPLGGQYVPRNEPPTHFRSQVSSPAPAIAAPAPVQHAAPPPVIHQSPSPAPAASAHAPVSGGHDQRGGYQGHAGGRGENRGAH